MHRPADPFIDADLFTHRNIHGDDNTLVTELIGLVDGDPFFKQQHGIFLLYAEFDQVCQVIGICPAIAPGRSFHGYLEAVVG